VVSEVIFWKNQKILLDAELSKEIVREKWAVNSGYARMIRSFLAVVSLRSVMSDWKREDSFSFNKWLVCTVI
jgi:hypothetical protein